MKQKFRLNKTVNCIYIQIISTNSKESYWILDIQIWRPRFSSQSNDTFKLHNRCLGPVSSKKRPIKSEKFDVY